MTLHRRRYNVILVPFSRWVKFHLKNNCFVLYEFQLRTYRDASLSGIKYESSVMQILQVTMLNSGIISKLPFC